MSLTFIPNLSDDGSDILLLFLSVRPSVQLKLRFEFPFHLRAKNDDFVKVVVTETLSTFQRLDK